METESEGVRACEVEITEVLTDRGTGALLERIRDLGGVGGDKDEREENEDRDAGVGELLSLAIFPDGLLGELVLLEGGEVVPAVRDVDVAWCLRVGGAVAIALALARLAAIAAATLLFFKLGVVGGRSVTTFGSGHTFSNCFRAVASNASIITVALSCHTLSKTQNVPRALSRTAGLGSPSAFFTDFSSSSNPPADSMYDFDR